MQQSVGWEQQENQYILKSMFVVSVKLFYLQGLHVIFIKKS